MMLNTLPRTCLLSLEQWNRSFANPYSRQSYLYASSAPYIGNGRSMLTLVSTK